MSQDTAHTVHVVIAADDGYAMPLAVAVRSILDHLDPSVTLDLAVIDGGIEAENKERCERTWRAAGDGGLTDACRAPRCRVSWLTPDSLPLDRLVVDEHFTLAAYFRLLVGDLLPPEVERILYVDPDVLFRANITGLFALDLRGSLLAASQDAFCPYVDPRRVIADFPGRRKWFYEGCAIPDAAERGIPPDQPYLNSGMLLVDLARFRQEHVGAQLLDYCRENNGRLLWADQCAINAVLGHRWLPLDAAWNVTPAVFRTRDHRRTIYDKATFERIRSTPAMIHFAGKSKPWHVGCRHPWRKAYRAAVERTAWAGWRPVHRPGRSWRRWLRIPRPWRGDARAA